MGEVAPPSRLQGFLSTALLLFLLAFSAPLAFAFAAISYLFRSNAASSSGDQQVTVLLNGAKMYKCLGLVRSLGKAGCRIIIAEQGIDSYFAVSRFSRYVSKSYRLPLVDPADPKTSRAYTEALLEIALRENVNLFLPCSGAGTTIEDAQAAAMIKAASTKTRCLIPSPSLTTRLHEKGQFMDLCQSLDVPCPKSSIVNSAEDALQVIKASEHPVILKAASSLDDVGRSDMTKYPLKGDAPTDLSRTLKRLTSGLALPISHRCPYIVQEFIEGSEWCTHATVINNQLVAFVCCPSSDMLMVYDDWTATAVGKEAEQWTYKFLKSWSESEEGKAEPLTGHFSVDFIRTESGELYPIECNPRVHTAICLLNTNVDFAKAYLHPSSTTGPVKPLPNTKARSWLGHDLVAVILPVFMPLAHWLHPYLRNDERVARFNIIDPTFDKSDPLPFFALYYVEWAWLLLRLLFTGTNFTRANVSTARVFTC